MNVYKRLMQVVGFKAGENVKFVLKKNRHLKRIQFSTMFYLHLPQNPPVFYPNYQTKITEIILDGNKIKEWDITFPQGIPIDMNCCVKWGTSSDTAIANPPKIESNSKLLIYVYETIKKKGIDTKELHSDAHEYTYFTCSCGTTYNKVIDVCKKCGNIITEGEICEKV